MFSHFARLLLILAFIQIAIAHLTSPPEAVSQRSDLTPRSSQPAILSLNSNTSITAGFLWCWPKFDAYLPTTVVGCRPTLNALKAFNNFSVRQWFKQGRTPRDPSPPPYNFHKQGSDCEIQVAVKDASIQDKFSFKDIRAKATHILEVCEEAAGLGGTDSLGASLPDGWVVRVLGAYKDDPDRGFERLSGDSVGNFSGETAKNLTGGALQAIGAVPTAETS